MIRSIYAATAIATLSLALAACSSSASAGDAALFTGGSGGASGAGFGGSGGTGGTTTPTGGGPGTGGGLNLGGAAGGGGGSSCSSGPTEDKDQDGFTVQDGDCNDCDANANPGAYDVPGNNVDEDCNGTPDDAQAGCDSAITDVADADPMNGARAIGLCQQATAGDKKWGVLSATYVQADGSPINPQHADGHGLLTGFGPNVNCQEGVRLLALSSGTARQPSDPGYESVSGWTTPASSPAPPGFPIDSPACPGVTTSGGPANDPAGLELKIRVPTNAKSFSFNFNFYTYEWPGFVCTSYNDFFVALQTPAPANAQLGNISFDSQGNPVSVNNGFLEACGCSLGPPCSAGGKTFTCSLGTGILQGTGFGDTSYVHAATGWLETVSPVDPGSEVTLRFAVWDAGDHILDSSVLIDNFAFSADEATGSSTKPVPVPK